MADNIVHIVLARQPVHPAGTKGISLFIVPKFNANAGGSLVTCDTEGYFLAPALDTAFAHPA